MKKNNSVVILIIAHKKEIDPYEQASFKQCYNILGNYPIRLISPKGLDVSAYRLLEPVVVVDYIHPKWQANYTMFNRLKISPLLYKKYRNYDYILYYELDAWVFKDELEYWCSKNYDYIGSPWLEGWGGAKLDAPFIGIGNGGFSLRKVKSALKILNTFSYVKQFSKLVEQYNRFNWKGKITHTLEFIKNLTIQNNTHHLFNDFSGHEDIFWGLYAANNFEWYKTPSIEEAIQFAFEVQPARLYEMNNHTLPFGCHGWWKYDFDFWKPFIEPYLQYRPINKGENV